MHEKRFNREIERLRDPERLSRMEVDRVADIVLTGLINPVAVLDVGTGSGVFAEKFSKKGLSVAGVDVNPEMIIAAKQFVSAGEFRIGVAEKLPFENQSFDLVFMGLLLHEVDDMAAVLNESYRVTRHRLAVLEWVYEEQSFGPPLEHRLASGIISDAAKKSGFSNYQKVSLSNFDLFIFDK